MGSISSSLKNKNIVIFGEVLADVFPDASLLGGAPFNVARHLQGFGLHPLFITRAGNDHLREQLISYMSEWGMDISGVQLDNAYPTGKVIVHMQGGGHRFEILPDQAYDFIDAQQALSQVNQHATAMLYFGSLAQRNTVSKDALEALIASTNTPRFLDINLRSPWYDKSTLEYSLRNANIVKMNEDELNIFAKVLDLQGSQQKDQALELVENYQLYQLIVTAGEQGAWMMDEHGVINCVNGLAQTTQLQDSVGAGDGFSSVYIVGSLSGWPIDVTLERANLFAAEICTIKGAAPESKDFYARFISEWGL